LGREHDAVGVVRQAAMMGQRNQAAGAAAGFFLLLAVRRRQHSARHRGHLDLAAPLGGSYMVHGRIF